ncbi:MAG: alpha-L-rhamnosidase N-terminal domain-containing protein [Planctomycetes bacterium]|nr:alpha-L-rhamnosidase N-terminal domain-containing protein [Planctomycetota bacterium]
MLQAAWVYGDKAVHHYSTETDTLTPKEWNAKWIWLGAPEDNTTLMARKTFQFSGQSLARLYISAQTHYQLWINGSFVTRGPARCASHHQSFDILDVQDLLVSGKNLVSVKVHNHGVMSSYYNKQLPGLLVQIDDEKGETIMVSDKSWKVQIDRSWDKRTEWVSGINAANFSGAYNMALFPAWWCRLDFNDSKWQTPTYISAKHWPIKPEVPYAKQKPWYDLIARDLPPLKEFTKRPISILKIQEAPQYAKYPTWGGKKIYDGLLRSIQDTRRPIKHSKVEGVKSFIKDKTPIRVENSYPVSKLQRKPIYHTTIIFDFGKVQDGYPYLSLKGEKKSIIDINYVPYLLDGIFEPSLIMDNFSDCMLLSGKKDRWESQEIRTFRYMSVTFRGDKPFVLDDVGMRVEEYPFIKRGAVSVENEPFVKDIFESTEKTLQGITTDAFTDNFQERRQYVQTSFYASLGNYASYADPYLQRRYLLQAAQDQLPNGHMPMWAPNFVYENVSEYVPGIFEANHFWMLGLRDYLLYTGEKETADGMIENAERCAEFLYRLQRKDHLLYFPPSYWIDWAKIQPGEQSFIINALQLLTFDSHAQTLNWLGYNNKAQKWQKRAQQIREALKTFWSEKDGLFVDNLNKGKKDFSFSEHSNSLAIAAGVANELQAEKIVDAILLNHSSHKMEESTLFNYWVCEALASQGRIRETIDFLKRRYTHMVYDKEIGGSLWEHSNLYVQDKGSRNTDADIKWVGRTWCTSQGENAFPSIILSRYVAGIRAILPGLRKISLHTLSSPYSSFEGEMPTPRGPIKVIRSKGECILELPADTDVVVPAKDIRGLGVSELKINKKVISVASLREDLVFTKQTKILIEWPESEVKQ